MTIRRYRDGSAFCRFGPIVLAYVVRPLRLFGRSSGRLADALDGDDRFTTLHLGRVAVSVRL